MIITVTNLLDSGAGSLRQAIISASNGDTIKFDPALAGGTIELTSGHLLVNKALTIIGLGSGALAVDRAGGSFEIFNFSSGVSSLSGITVKRGIGTNGGGIHNSTTLTLDDVIVVDGNATNGGGIFNDSTITMSNCKVRFSKATNGGGVYNDGTLTMTGICEFLDNSAFDSGGGVYNTGTVTASECLLVLNDAANNGGGFYNDGTFTILVSTFTNNSAEGSGSGFYNGVGAVTIVRCTLSDQLTGKVIYNYAGTLIIDNSTLANNPDYVLDTELGSSTLNHCTVTANAMGIRNQVNGVLVLGTTILAGNDSLDLDNAVGSEVDSNGYNLFGAITTPFSLGTGDQVGLTAAQLHLGALADNGGPTQTCAVLADSPALDAGTNVDAPSVDQRGFSRIVRGTCDIGAYEADLSPSSNYCVPAGSICTSLTDPTPAQVDAAKTNVNGMAMMQASGMAAQQFIVLDVVILPNATSGVAYSYQLAAHGGHAPYVYAATGAMPAGLALSSSGLVSGTPTDTAPKLVSFTVVITGASGIACHQEVEIFVGVGMGIAITGTSMFTAIIRDTLLHGSATIHGTSTVTGTIKNGTGVQASDDMESYSDEVSLNGLNGGTNWNGSYADGTGFIGVQSFDDMESYSDGSSVNGLNGGTGWSGAFADR